MKYSVPFAVANGPVSPLSLGRSLSRTVLNGFGSKVANSHSRVIAQTQSFILACESRREHKAWA